MLRPQPRSRDALTSSDLRTVLMHHVVQPRQQRQPLAAFLPRAMHAVRMMLAFYGMLRASELTEIIVHEDTLQVHADRIRLFLARSKTDQAGKGRWVTIGARPGDKCCPVEITTWFLREAGYVRRSAPGLCCGPLLRKTSGPRGDYRLAQSAPSATPLKALSSDTITRHWSELCEAVGIVKDIKSHSCRIGGGSAAAAAAAANPGLAPGLRNARGRWLSEQCADGYVHAQCVDLARFM